MVKATFLAACALLVLGGLGLGARHVYRDHLAWHVVANSLAGNLPALTQWALSAECRLSTLEDKTPPKHCQPTEAK